MADMAKRLTTMTSGAAFGVRRTLTDRAWWIWLFAAVIWCVIYVVVKPENVPAPSHTPTVVDFKVFAFQIVTVLLISWFWFTTVRYAAKFRAESRPAVRQGRRSTDRTAHPGSAVVAIEALPERLPLTARMNGHIRSWGRRPMVPLVLATIPGFLFAYATRNEYNSAVFVMALVAIYVAAEHYGALEEQKEEHRAAVDDLRTALDNNDLHIGTLLNRDGLAKWRNHVYQNYLQAKERISAIIRILDIDPEWWACTDCASWESPSGDAWQAAFEKYKSDAGNTLYRVLCSSPEYRSDPEELLPAPRWDKVQFVAEMQWALDAGPSAERFNDLYGLVWQLVVMAKVRAARKARHGPIVHDDGSVPYVRMRVGSAPFWMHAVDNTVYQVLERKRDDDGNVAEAAEEDEKPLNASTRSRRALLERSSARDITTEMTHARDRDRLSDWAHTDIRHYASRGCNGEEYVFSVLRRAAFQAELREGTGLTDANLESILRQLGLQQWLDSPVHMTPKENERCAKNICISTFKELLRLRFAEGTRALLDAPRVARKDALVGSAPSNASSESYKVSDLWREVL